MVSKGRGFEKPLHPLKQNSGSHILNNLDVIETVVLDLLNFCKIFCPSLNYHFEISFVITDVDPLQSVSVKSRSQMARDYLFEIRQSTKKDILILKTKSIAFELWTVRY
jgi:hypothetical protein